MTSEQMGKWKKKVIAAAEEFDAFEGMLDEVMHAHRQDRQVVKKAAASVPTLAEPTGGPVCKPSCPPRVRPSLPCRRSLVRPLRSRGQVRRPRQTGRIEDRRE